MLSLAMRSLSTDRKLDNRMHDEEALLLYVIWSEQRTIKFVLSSPDYEVEKQGKRSDITCSKHDSQISCLSRFLKSSHTTQTHANQIPNSLERNFIVQ